MRKRAEPTAIMRAPGELWIELWGLSKLVLWPANPRAHNDQVSLGESFERYGFVDPIIIDEGTGRVVAGHGRIEKLEEMRRDRKSPPGRIGIGADGEWLVPVLRGVTFTNEVEAEAYLLACNRITEKSGWVDGLLGSALERHVANPTGIGWNPDEANDLIARAKRTLETPPPKLDPPEDFEEHDVGEKATITCPRCKFAIVCDS